MTSVVEAKCRLPCSNSPDEEFQGPSGQWFTIHRAIVYDSWLTWRHALPGCPLTEPIDREVACSITALAQRIHSFHMNLPEYRRLMVSPFRVGRWWDPASIDEWSTGRCVLLRLEQYNAQSLAHRIPDRLNLKVRQQSENWIEVSLPADLDCPVHSLDYSRVVTTET